MRTRARHKKDPGQESGSVLSTVLSTLLVCLCVAVIAGVAGSTLGYYRLDIVLSGSMKPAFDPGDLIYATKKPANKVAPGDVILFKTPPKYGSQPVTHRVVNAEITPSGVVIIRTKGDNNDAADPWQAEVTTDTVWLVRQHIPKVGYVATWAKTWWPLLLSLVVTIPLISTARRHTRRTDDETGSRPATSPLRWLVTVLWFTPAAVTVATGVWVSLNHVPAVGQLTQSARAWHAEQTGPESVLLDRFTTRLQMAPTSTGTVVASLLDDPLLVVHDGQVQRIVDVAPVPAGRPVTLTAEPTKPNDLSDALRVGVSLCAEPWERTDDGYTCPAGPTTLVGDSPLAGMTVSVFDAGEAPAGRAHLLLKLRVPSDADPAAGLITDLDVRLDAP